MDISTLFTIHYYHFPMKNFHNILLLGISTILSGAVNYAYHPIMLQFLDMNTFAEFESLISVFNILGVLVG